MFGQILEKVSKDNPYLLFQKARILNTGEAESLKMKQFLQCMEETASVYLKQQIMNEAVSTGIDLSGFAKLVDLETWKAYMGQIIEKTSMDQFSKLQETAHNLGQTDSLHGLWLEKLVREKRLIREYPSGLKLMKGLSEYIQSVLSYYKEQYREDMFSDERRRLLPEDCRFAVLVSEGLACIEEQRLPDAARLLRQALRYYPSMTGVIHEVIRQLKNSADNPARNAGAEFELLAEQMKNNLSTMIDQGQYTQALPVMQQLCTLLPEDLGLLKLRQKFYQKADNHK